MATDETASKDLSTDGPPESLHDSAERSDGPQTPASSVNASAGATADGPRPRPMRVRLLGGVAAMIVAGAATTWAVVSSGTADGASSSAGASSTSPAPGRGSTVEPSPDDDPPALASDEDGRSPAPGGVQNRSMFAREAERALEDVGLDLRQVDIALDHGLPLSEATSTLRERAVALRSLTPPSDVTGRWTATLDELDRWLAILDGSGRGGSAGQGRESSVAIGLVLADLRQIVSSLP